MPLELKRHGTMRQQAFFSSLPKLALEAIVFGFLVVLVMVLLREK